jgi:hypothetical protein
MIKEYGIPTAKKVSGCEWYLPAVTTAVGPKPLPHGNRQETRSKAITEARRILREIENQK